MLTPKFTLSMMPAKQPYEYQAPAAVFRYIRSPLECNLMCMKDANCKVGSWEAGLTGLCRIFNVTYDYDVGFQVSQKQASALCNCKSCLFNKFVFKLSLVQKSDYNPLLYYDFSPNANEEFEFKGMKQSQYLWFQLRSGHSYQSYGGLKKVGWKRFFLWKGGLGTSKSEQNKHPKIHFRTNDVFAIMLPQ